jgi:sulfoxide reductase heme-binding subunit YedZ
VNGFEWEAARAGGIVAYVLLSAVVVIGLALAGKERLEGWPRFAIEDVHRFAGMLVGSFVALHVLTIAIDSQAHFSFVQLVVPFALLVALAIANHYRKRISCRLWRRLHYLNFAVWLAATWHGIGAGTDSGSAWLLWIYVGAIGAVALLTARRILRAAPPSAPELQLVPRRHWRELEQGASAARIAVPELAVLLVERHFE